ncbi:MAG: proprotein convertase P-domain-containing protein [Deltaproteobacteria bacterium]|nr:proprotein convertase P-domain-containing protein [Deltaproteobacteria bacterium]
MSRKTVRFAGVLAALIIFGSGSAVFGAGTRTFTATDTPLRIPPSGTSGTTTSEIVVEESCVIEDLNVTVDITHTWNADLDLSLGDAGTRVELSSDNGGSADELYLNTTFDDEADKSIVGAQTPFDGAYRPENPLAKFDGKNAQGTWTLTVDDRAEGDLGTLYNWSITVGCLGRDHYLTYKIKAEPKFDKVDVVLTDQFQSGTFTVEKRETLLTPVDKNGEGISDSETHLLGYKIKGPKFDTVPKVLVENQFGLLVVDVEKPEDLLVPASKSLTDPGISAPNNDLHIVNHFLCYKVKLSEGKPEFQPILGVSLVDQFEDKLYDIVKPKRLCTPVDKNGEGIKTFDTPDDHLLCYEAKQAQFFVNDQFGPGQVDGKTKRELCVPSIIKTF